MAFEDLHARPAPQRPTNLAGRPNQSLTLSRGRTKRKTKTDSDIWLVPIEGGEPRQLTASPKQIGSRAIDSNRSTFHPAPARVPIVLWTGGQLSRFAASIGTSQMSLSVCFPLCPPS